MLSVALAAVTLRPLTQDGSYLVLGWLLIGLIGGTSIVLRRLRVGGGTVLASQVTVWLFCSLGIGLESEPPGGAVATHPGRTTVHTTAAPGRGGRRS